MTNSLPSISACIITFNEEHNLRRCLDSVTWCHEIVVLDSFSTDKTVDIAREYTDRVFQKEWQGYIHQRNSIRDMATGEWVLFLDADEEVSDRMREQILEELGGGANGAVGYSFPRLVYYLGKWIRHGEWYPDKKLRLFVRERGVSGGEEPHDMVIVDGPVKTLSGEIFHYTYDSISHHVAQMNRFSQISAEAKFKAGKQFRWFDFLWRPPFRFFKSYVIKLGVLDGWHGMLIASVSAFGVMVKYAKLRELHLLAHQRRRDQQRPGDAPAGGAD
jgi:glycosyltransferase involved in cell wall biosynthesis